MPHIRGVSWHVHITPDKDGAPIARSTVNVAWREDLVGKGGVMATAPVQWTRGVRWNEAVADALEELAALVRSAPSEPEKVF